MTAWIYRLLLALITLSPLSGIAQVEGIYGFPGSYEEALAAADSQGKQVFVLADPLWSSSRQRLLKELFPDDEVRALYKAQNICLVMGDERANMSFFRKWRVRAYPTFLFLNSEGELLRSKMGMQDKAGILVLGTPESVDE